MELICSVIMCAAPPLSQAADGARKDSGWPLPGRACRGGEWSVPSCHDHNGLWVRRGGAVGVSSGRASWRHWALTSRGGWNVGGRAGGQFRCEEDWVGAASLSPSREGPRPAPWSQLSAPL